MSEKNQTAAEENAVMITGRKGLEKAVASMQTDIMALASPAVAKAGSVWLQRAIISIANDDNPKIRECLQTKSGQFSIIKCFERAATMGLQLGGQFKHAHISAFDGQAELIVDQNGYKHMTCHGDGAVLSDITIRRVYDGEQFRIDFADNSVSHSYDGKADRGKLIGVYCILVKTNGDKIVDYMTRTEALLVRDFHSRGYAAFKSGKIKDNFWHTDEDAAIEKTAAKKFLKPFAAKSEALSMMYTSEDDQEIIEQIPAPPPRDVSDRMAGHLDRKVERATADPAPKMRQADPVEPVAVEPVPVEEKSPEVELF